MRFLPKHFDKCAMRGRHDLKQLMADTANNLLEEWLAQADTVYSPAVGTKEKYIWSNRKGLCQDHAHPSDTHKGKIVCIEEIYKLKGPIKI